MANQNAPYPYYNFVTDQNNNPVPNVVEDSPAYGLQNTQTQTQLWPAAAFFGAGGSYNMYLMFQPNTPGSIPVPLAVIPWSWSGGAVNSAGNWTLYALGTYSPQASPAGLTGPRD